MSTATDVTYKLIKKIKDEKFDVDELHHYSLSVQFGNRDFQALVVDTRENYALLLEDYVLSAVNTYGELMEVMETLFDDHHLLKAGFWKQIRISVKNNRFSLVPSTLFSEENLVDFLRLNAAVDTDRDEVKYYKHLKNDAVNVFSMNKIQYNWLSEIYKNTNVGAVHQSSGLIEGILSQIDRYQDNNMFLYVDRFKLHIITTRNKKLEYYNQFVIKKFEDYIKYIMTVLKGLGHDQKTTPVILWGYVGKQSPHFHEFAKYIKNISFGERPDFLKFGYFFDEVQDHHFFDLYSLNACE